MGFGPIRHPCNSVNGASTSAPPKTERVGNTSGGSGLFGRMPPALPHLPTCESTPHRTTSEKPSRRQHAYGQDRAHAVCGASSPRAHGEHHVQHQVLGRDAQQWLSALASWKAAYSASGSRRWAACSLASSMASFMARLEWGTAATRLSAAPFRGRQAGVAWLRPRKMRELRRRAGRPEHPASAPCFALNTGHRAKAKREADFSEFIGRASLHCMVIARLETDAVGATVNSATAGHRTGAQRKRLSRAARRRASASASATVSHHHFTSTTPPSSIFKRKHMHTSARIGMTPSKAM